MLGIVSERSSLALGDSEYNRQELEELGFEPTGVLPLIIDLTRLEQLSGPEAEMLNRYLTMIQVQRQDFNGRVLTIRASDLQALAAILGTGLDGAGPRLDDLGLSYNP